MLYREFMTNMGRLLMRDAGLENTMSAEERDAKLQQFVQDAMDVEEQVAYVRFLAQTRSGA